MRIAIMGATGGTGMALVREALERGHDVAAWARTPSKLGEVQARVTVHQGDVLQDDLEGWIQGADAVIVSLGGSSLGKQTIREDGTARIIEAMKAAAVERLIIVSSLGAGDSKTRALLGVAGLFFVHTMIRRPIADHTRQEALVQGSGLSWTIARPGGLTDAPKSRRYRTDGGGEARVPRADVAEAIVSWAEEGAFVGEAIPLKV